MAAFEHISYEEAKKIMDGGSQFFLLDAREQSEFDAGHIPGAVLIPYHDVLDMAEELIPDKDELILVYCLSGKRSRAACRSLALLGYTNIKDFGGIMGWPYEITR